jgi:hypothetical protein
LLYCVHLREGPRLPWELVALTIDLAAKAKYFTYQQMEAEQREKYGSARAWRGSEDAKKMLPVANPFIPGDPVEDNYFIKVTKATETFRESFGRRGSIDGLGTANPVNPQPGRNSVAVSEQNAMAAEEEEEDEEDDEGEKEEEATVYFERYHQRDMVRLRLGCIIALQFFFHFITDPLRQSVPLCLTRRCDRTLGALGIQGHDRRHDAYPAVLRPDGRLPLRSSGPARGGHAPLAFFAVNRVFVAFSVGAHGA